jgi:lipopolysaccharide/colanic/teichoic acid biosynthesis glycosyltransferase
MASDWTANGSSILTLVNHKGVSRFARKQRQLTAKRVIDIMVSGTALIMLSPLMLVVALLIKIDSRGPVFFHQQRWGLGLSTINVIKFRSMRTDLCDSSGVEQTVENDPRITRIGRIIRKTNIDELPQLLNVLRGEMSLVGPRCHAIGMRAAGVVYEELFPHYHLRHQMRPGITGLAQARGFRGPTDTVFKAKARLVSDLHYVENFSLLLDASIIVATLRREIFGGTGF